MEEFVSQYYLVDIDGTLTDYRSDGSFELLHHNFLFPIFRDLMAEMGWRREDAQREIGQLAERLIFWDYSDFIAAFSLPVSETFARIKAWHRKNLIPCRENVEQVRRLASQGKRLFIMSNNPYMGCIFKLQAAGLAEDDFSSPYFCRILGTNLLRGCKSDPNVWRRAFAQIPVPISQIGVIGDNPVEDGEIPRSLGVQDTILFSKKKVARGNDWEEEKTDR